MIIYYYLLVASAISLIKYIKELKEIKKDEQ